MNRTFTFTLKKEEYLSFLRFQSAHSKHAKGIRMWLRISLPALILCIILFFSLYDQMLWGVLSVIIIILWELFGTPMLFKKYLFRTIDEETIKHMGVNRFQKVNVSFRKDKIIYKDAKTHEIFYQDILRMIPAEDVFIFQYKPNGTLLLPYRLFDQKEDIDEFFKEFEMAWKPYRSS